jgi:sulfur carrier protein
MSGNNSFGQGAVPTSYNRYGYSLTGTFKGCAPQPTLQPMRVILPDQEIRNIERSPAPVENILLELGINPLEVIVSRNGALVPEDTIVGADDEIRIIRISHGG